MKVSDEVVEAGCKAAARAVGERWPDDFTEAEEYSARNLIRAALEAVLPLVLGEPVAWFRERYDPETGIEFNTVTFDPGSVEPDHIPLYAPKEQQP